MDADALKQQYEAAAQADEAKKQEQSHERSCDFGEYEKEQEELDEKLYDVERKTDGYQVLNYKHQVVSATVKTVNTVTSGLANAPVGMMSMLFATPGASPKELAETELKNHQKVSNAVGSITGVIGGRIDRNISRNAGDLEVQREEIQHQKAELAHKMRKDRHVDKCQTCETAAPDDKSSVSKVDVDSKDSKDDSKVVSPPNVSLEALQSSKSAKKTEAEPGVQTHVIPALGD